MSKPLKLGIAGLGTVGSGLLQLLAEHGPRLAQSLGRTIEVAGVSARSRGKKRTVPLEGLEWFEAPEALAAAPGIDVFVELIGGDEGAPKKAVEAALAAGKPVVTANKALLARHGTELAKLAEKAGVALNFEAAAAGGIPVIKTLREALAGNQIRRVYGILNGTCNYILTKMQDEQRSFDNVLAEAQAKGYAEADPTFDIGGFDTAHKLALLTSLAFGTRVALMTESGIEQRVHPAMVPKHSAIAEISGVTNCVAIDGDFVGNLLLAGPGAGARATASAVMSDILDVARGASPPPFGVPAAKLKAYKRAKLGQHQGAYYVRLSVFDRPGAMAKIAGRMGERDVSLESIVQRRPRGSQPGIGASPTPGAPTSVILITHETTEEAIRAALEAIDKDGQVSEKPQMIRIEPL
jgi:homoserine dehydrogenase